MIESWDLASPPSPVAKKVLGFRVGMIPLILTVLNRIPYYNPC